MVLTPSRRRSPHLMIGGTMRCVGRAFLLLITTLTLTIEVPYRPDPDGQQAPHFFFLPRATWEMNVGRDMPPPEEADHPDPAAASIGHEAAYEDPLPEMPLALINMRRPAPPRLWRHTPAEPAFYYCSVCHAPPVPPPRVNQQRLLALYN